MTEEFYGEKDDISLCQQPSSVSLPRYNNMFSVRSNTNASYINGCWNGGRFGPKCAAVSFFLLFIDHLTIEAQYKFFLFSD